MRQQRFDLPILLWLFLFVATLLRTTRGVSRSMQTHVSGFGARTQKKSIFGMSKLDPSAAPLVGNHLSTTDVDSDNATVTTTTTTTTTTTNSNSNNIVEQLLSNWTKIDGNSTNGQPITTDRPRLWVQRTREPDTLLFQVRDDDDVPEKTLKVFISEKTGDWLVEPIKDNSIGGEIDGWAPIEGLYGMYQVPSGILWVLIAKSEPTLTAPPLSNGNKSWWKIRRVTNLELVHLGRPDTLLSPSELKEEVRQLRLLRKSLKQHDLYFVPNDEGATDVVDMTRNLQHALVNKVQNSSTEDEVDLGFSWWRSQEQQQPDSRFFWNQEMVQPLLERYETFSPRQVKQQQATAILLDYVIPVTSAFVAIQSNLTVGTEASYQQVLISRRSRFRAGTRFTKRGADATGAVANYAESEQVCFVVHPQTNILHQVLSHVQTRGSIPLRWSSPTDIKTYRPRINIGTDPLAQARALRLHLTEQHALYASAPKNDTPRSSDTAKIVFVNLVDKHSDQGRLGRTFDAVLNALMDVYHNVTMTTNKESDMAPVGFPLGPKSVEHVWFDFHAEVKNGKWGRLSTLLKQLKPSLLEHGFFHALAPTRSSGKSPATGWKVKRLQNGVIRTNCMDCLDRTNVVQSILGRYILERQLSTAAAHQHDAQMGSMSTEDKKVWASHDKAFRKNSLTLPWKEGEVAHRHLWADNADAISRLYAGTAALKGDFTRTGKRTKMGALDDGMNSIQRYYLNNFLDADRQEGIDLMVGFSNFTNVGFAAFHHDDSDLLNNTDTSLDLTTIQEAARQTFFENILSGVGANDKQRSNLESSLGEINVVATKTPGSLTHRELDLRWLPGDLQCHLKSQATLVGNGSRDNGNTKDDRAMIFEFSSAAALLEIDRRAGSDQPWWAGVDLEDMVSDEGEGDYNHKENARKGSDEAETSPSVIMTTQPSISTTQMLGVLAIAMRAPMALAGTVVGLLGLVFMPEVIQYHLNNK